jgi:hypothetical protein
VVAARREVVSELVAHEDREQRNGEAPAGQDLAPGAEGHVDEEASGPRHGAGEAWAGPRHPGAGQHGACAEGAKHGEQEEDDVTNPPLGGRDAGVTQQEEPRVVVRQPVMDARPLAQGAGKLGRGAAMLGRHHGVDHLAGADVLHPPGGEQGGELIHIRGDLLTLLRGGPYNIDVRPPLPCSPDELRPGTAVATGRLRQPSGIRCSTSAAVA